MGHNKAGDNRKKKKKRAKKIEQINAGVYKKFPVEVEVKKTVTTVKPVEPQYEFQKWGEGIIMKILPPLKAPKEYNYYQAVGRALRPEPFSADPEHKEGVEEIWRKYPWLKTKK